MHNKRNYEIENLNLKSLFYKYIVRDNIRYNFNVSDVYFDIDLNLLDEMKSRCIMLNNSIEADYFIICENGDALVDLGLFIKYAKKHRLDVLEIPEGFNLIYLQEGYTYYSGKIIFPSTLKRFVFNLGIIDEILESDSSEISSGYNKEFSDLGVLDFSKCLNLKSISYDAFKNLKIDTLIFPKSLEDIDFNFHSRKYNYIKNVYINSPVELSSSIYPNMKVKNNRLKYYVNTFGNDINNINILDELIIIKGGYIDGGVNNISNSYLPVSYNDFEKDLNLVMEALRDKLSLSSELFKWHEIVDNKGLAYYDVYFNDILSNTNLINYFTISYRGTYLYFLPLLFLYKVLYLNPNDVYRKFISMLVKNNISEVISHVYLYNSDIDLDELDIHKRKYIELYIFNSIEPDIVVKLFMEDSLVELIVGGDN